MLESQMLTAGGLRLKPKEYHWYWLSSFSDRMYKKLDFPLLSSRVYLEGVWCGLSTRWFHLRWFHLCAVHMLFLRWFHLRWFRLFAVHMLFLRWFRLRWFRLFAVHMLSTRWFHFGREVISLLDVTSTSHAYIIIVSIQSIFQMPLTTLTAQKVKIQFGK